MAALARGTRVPQIDLLFPDASPFRLHDALQRGALALVFFKVSCPVCQMALPWLARMQRDFGGRHAQLIGVSQDDPSATATFLQRYEVDFPVVLDPAPQYSASNGFGLTHVPSVFWIGANGMIEQSVVGFARADYEALAERMAVANQVQPQSLFGESPGIPAFKAG